MQRTTFKNLQFRTCFFFTKWLFEFFEWLFNGPSSEQMNIKMSVMSSGVERRGGHITHARTLNARYRIFHQFTLVIITSPLFNDERVKYLRVSVQR